MKNISLNLRKNTLVITLISGVLCSFLFINSFKIDKNTKTLNKTTEKLFAKSTNSKLSLEDPNPSKKLHIGK